MNFMERLNNESKDDREYLLSSPIIGRCMSGDITLNEYVSFLTQAYHHVKHTVPLLMAVGARLPAEKEWLREAVAEYIEEELGHHTGDIDPVANCYRRGAAGEDEDPVGGVDVVVASIGGCLHEETVG